MNVRRLTILALICPLILTANAATTKTAPLRVMTYNLRYDNPQDSLDNWKYRKDFIASMIGYHAPAIFGIQEGLIHQVHELAAALPEYSWCGVGRDDGKEAGKFSAIFFDNRRFEKLADSTFWLSPTPDRPSKGWDAALNRIVTWAKLKDKASAREFFVFNTHFDHMGTTAREESARLLLREVRRIAKDRPAIVTGDFNSTDKELPYSILTGRSAGQSASLTDAFADSRTPHLGPLKTYCGFDVHKGIIGERIDFVFHTNGLQVLRHATLTDFLPNEHFPSDHLPVIADIVLP